MIYITKIVYITNQVSFCFCFPESWLLNIYQHITGYRYWRTGKKGNIDVTEIVTGESSYHPRTRKRRKEVGLRKPRRSEEGPPKPGLRLQRGGCPTGADTPEGHNDTA